MADSWRTAPEHIWALGVGRLDVGCAFVVALLARELQRRLASETSNLSAP